MVNCNPETVSTDPDTSDRLYFEPLTAEDVLEIVRREQEKGELAGRDRPIGRADPAQARRRTAGGGRADPRHQPDSIDLAEDRERFAALVARLGLKQPANGIARSRDEALQVAERIGYPVLLRPVLRARRARHGGGRRARAARPLYRHRGRRCRATARC